MEPCASKKLRKSRARKTEVLGMRTALLRRTSENSPKLPKVHAVPETGMLGFTWTLVREKSALPRSPEDRQDHRERSGVRLRLVR